MKQTTDPQVMVNRLQQQINMKQEPMQDQMFYWTLAELAESVDGEWIGPLASEEDIRFNSISTDTRTIEPGALYIALKGENFDGHDFVAEAVKQGAAAVLVSRSVETSVPGVLVEDTRIALGRFARWHRRNMPVKKLVAITGSNGKTTTKAMLLNLFSGVGNTMATEGNLNNDYGVPRTLLKLRPEHEYAIIEMGANHPKEIEYLTLMAEPDIALLNNASGAHLEGFGSLQGVIETKGEIFLGLNRLNSPGTAIINTDSPGFEYWQEELERLGIEQVLKFGEAPEADVRLQGFSSYQDQVEFELSVKGELHKVGMPIMGKHNALNAAACVAVCLAAGLSWSEIQPGLSGFTGVAGRLQKTKIGQGWLIDDSYNANPESVKAAIDTLSALPGASALCLGAMAELGESTQQAHEAVAEYARQKGLERLYVLGDAAATMPEVFGEGARWFESHQTMVDTLLAEMAEGNVCNVLVKGSRSARMEKVVQGVEQVLNVDDGNNV
ncbi:UDP-N-acetylmuramoyl-tripeptide--D-alanyl-D-alanine ligase [Thiomicrorhabdus sp. ZW0627]|uniref:UDP-N-acetylmuramoyl-tripeptide--D-alanyl-D- alanine ligase n=1 Tax=Thiomicrorhabdus sp. ZW0627 TaxID=3039774 RepID=UPI0024363F46|nr:UDP-N-acetylmuramoyl-tripeptide--D-alanyl-D-alanine ligase [Thiomicrorhabdus sp. ZW0627]MDG6774019.1 UDP-N-acetylmuramoyl-tripeptide--D-alanyl-D-alanine ligase [Thiomicrorhabdus sp. ZW0627]